MFFFDGMRHVYIRATSLCRILRHRELLKHLRNPYSIERACHKLSKTPSHALIDAVGGPHHHFECTTCALSDPNRIRRDSSVARIYTWLLWFPYRKKKQNYIKTKIKHPETHIFGSLMWKDKHFFICGVKVLLIDPGWGWDDFLGRGAVTKWPPRSFYLIDSGFFGHFFHHKVCHRNAESNVITIGSQGKATDQKVTYLHGIAVLWSSLL